MSTIKIGEMAKAKTSLARQCEICGEAFEILSIHDQRRLCPNCVQILRKIIKREQEDEV